jgi:hypothetical protein
MTLGPQSGSTAPDLRQRAIVAEPPILRAGTAAMHAVGKRGAQRRHRVAGVDRDP